MLFERRDAACVSLAASTTPEFLMNDQKASLDIFQSCRKVPRIIGALLLVATLALPMYLRTVYESSTALAKGRSFAEKGELKSAIPEYRRAVQWRSIFNPYSESALDELRAIANNSTVEVGLRISALENAKSGLRGSRSFVSPERYEVPTSLSSKFQSEIRSISELPPVAPLLDPSQKDPNYGFQMTALVCFFCWTGAIVQTIWSSFLPDGRILWGKAYRRLAFAGAAYAGWIVSLTLA